MQWTPDDIRLLLERLRAHGNDFEDVEVKRGSGGLPDVGRTLSAFGNMPNGGLVVIGLDEEQDFAPVGVSDAAAIEQGIASTARNGVVPPVHVSFEEAEVDGRTLVMATVAGLPSHQRPCRFQGEAWLRQSDGDYRMSELEIQQLLALRERPRYDAAPVEAASRADLDAGLTAAFISNVRTSSRRLANQPDDEVLRRVGVLAPDGVHPTVAGLYALGAYPQQFLPSLSITAAVQLDPRSGQRTRDLVHVDGPLPELLDGAVEWVRRNTMTTTHFGADGHGRDETELPMVAVRELIGNALVHRDVGPHTRPKKVEIRLKAGELVITNPGGLYGVSLQQLGTDHGKSAVNEYLYDICRHVRTHSGSRVIEGEGGGIREVQRSLRAAMMRPPHFVDAGVRFTAIVPRHSLLRASDLDWLAAHDPTSSLSSVQKQIVTSMRYGHTWTNAAVREDFSPIDSRDATAALQGLVGMGLAVSHGERGRTQYAVHPSFATSLPAEPDVVVRQPAMVPGSTTGGAGPGAAGGDPDPVGDPGQLTTNAAVIIHAVADGATTALQIEHATGLTARQVTYALGILRNAGVLKADGGRGRRGMTYQLAGSAESPDTESPDTE